MADQPKPVLSLAPFRALRYPRSGPALAAVLAPPYDVIDDAARTVLQSRDDANVVRLTLPGSTPEAYGEAAARLAQWVADGTLVLDALPALYVYEIAASDAVVRGLVGALGLVAPEAGVVLPHEDTMAGPVADRLALTEATGANLEPILLVHDGADGVTTRLIRDPASFGGRRVAAATTSDGARHTVWAVTEPEVHKAVDEHLATRVAVIADGHHRYATYLRYQALRRAEDGAGPWDRGLTMVVDTRAFAPAVHAIHRVIAGLGLREAAELARRCWSVDWVAGPEQGLAQAAGQAHAFVLADGQDAALLRAPSAQLLTAAMPAGRSPQWRSLDVSVLHHALVQGTWGLDDSEETVLYRHSRQEALAAADAGHSFAVLMQPTPVEAVMEVAGSGERMPRKSTLFTPKPSTGLLIRQLSAG